MDLFFTLPHSLDFVSKTMLALPALTCYQLEYIICIFLFVYKVKEKNTELKNLRYSRSSCCCFCCYVRHIHLLSVLL